MHHLIHNRPIRKASQSDDDPKHNPNFGPIRNGLVRSRIQSEYNLIRKRSGPNPIQLVRLPGLFIQIPLYLHFFSLSSFPSTSPPPFFHTMTATLPPNFIITAEVHHHVVPPPLLSTSSRRTTTTSSIIEVGRLIFYLKKKKGGVHHGRSTTGGGVHQGRSTTGGRRLCVFFKEHHRRLA